MRKIPRFTKLKKSDKLLSFFDFDALDFAKHLTAADWRTFKDLRPKEFFHKAWQGADKDKSAPHVLHLIRGFNKLSYWIATEIVMTANPKQRVAVVERFIDLIKALKRLQNFHAMFAAYSGLNMLAIQNLTETWKGVSKKHIKVIQEIETTIDAKSHFKSYRESVKQITPPFVPFEGVFLADLTFIEENPTIVDEMINFEKMTMIADIMKTIRAVQTNTYTFSENDVVKAFLDKVMVLDEDEIFERSKRIILIESSPRSTVSIHNR
jgi:son of sevenless-like protein